MAECRPLSLFRLVAVPKKTLTACSPVQVQVQMMEFKTAIYRSRSVGYLKDHREGMNLDARIEGQLQQMMKAETTM
jgi:hypothetical protein